MDCKQIEEQEVLERYLLDQLNEEELEEFEQHYFECGACFSQLQTTLTVRSELRHHSPARARVRVAFLRGTWAWAPAFLTVVLLFAVGMWWYSARSRPSRQVSSQPRAINPAPTVSSVPALEQLARVEPPPYFATALRGADDEAHEQFRSAMQSYSKGNYAKAISGLRAAVKNDPQVVSFNFYLGACYLLTGESDSAVIFFRKTISLDDPTYSEQAHFYLAKAYLKKQDVAGAQKELQATVRFHGVKETEAGQLLRQLRK